MIQKSWFTGILIEPNPARSPFNPAPRYAGELYGAQKHQYFSRTQRDLITISQTPLGADLLNLIRKRFEGVGTSGSGADRTVTIQFRPHEVNEGASTMAMAAGDRASKTKKIGTRDFRFAGKGSKTYVSMHNSNASEAIYSRLAGKPTPTWVALAHELIHAFHHLSGTTYTDESTTEAGTAKREEMVTTGLGVYANTRLSENAIRDSVGLPRREFYSFPGDHGQIGSLMQPEDQLRPMGYWLCSCLQHVL